MPRKREFIGSAWIELPEKVEPEHEGDIFSRGYERGAGKAIRLLGRYKVRCIFSTKKSDMVSLLITFNSGETGMARAKAGKQGFINIYDNGG